ncbi:hypothetical protein WLF18_12200 [Pseudomonas shirazensis]|uniref:Uncharacterized protein n=1 Tax=Pseudomonas shirazensis TaxID=2745494 RepID=A0ABU8ZZU2_9PSED|nr:hypothetical protein [Pseudomonas sp. MYb187]PRA61962.1 hypothetical protein CQ065_17000 [Pseudomonas sp. MYb187]
MTNVTNTYGTTVVEFFKYSDAEFQQLLDKRTEQYHKSSEGLHYKGLSANVDWVRDTPLEVALIELQHILKDGFTIVKVVTQPLWFKAILRKPEDVIAIELPKLAELALGEYEQERYQRNVAETARQVAISVERSERQAAAAAAKAADKKRASDEQKALADLLSAYAEPTEVAA